MLFPAMLAFEYSDYANSGFPTAIAWTLEDAMYKATLIQPTDTWLNNLNADATLLERPVTELLEFGENIVDVVRELQSDQAVDTLYAEDHEMAAQMLERLFEEVGQECPYEVAPMTELFSQWSEHEVNDSRRLFIDRLDLSPHIAEQNILLWRATYAQLHNLKNP